jgi:hypothetical protein
MQNLLRVAIVTCNMTNTINTLISINFVTIAIMLQKIIGSLCYNANTNIVKLKAVFSHVAKISRGLPWSKEILSSQ